LRVRDGGASVAGLAVALTHLSAGLAFVRPRALTSQPSPPVC
jgi:hypothetical protein